MKDVYVHGRVFSISNGKLSNSPMIFGRINGRWTEGWAVGDTSDGGVADSTLCPDGGPYLCDYASQNYTWLRNTWQHVAVVRDDHMLHAYINGSETTGTNNKTPDTLPSDTPAASTMGITTYNYLGRAHDGASSSASTGEMYRYYGMFDEFLISCRPYTANEIKLLAARP